MGLNEAVGHVDFFVNGGRHQPGCSRSDEIGDGIFCSHSRAWEYWVEALKNPGFFLGVACDSYDQFLNHRCNTSANAYMTNETLPKQGKYYLQTRKSPPYGLRLRGLLPVNTDPLENLINYEVVEKLKDSFSKMPQLHQMLKNQS